MAHTIEPLKVPLHTDEHGTIRVGGTRVTLDSVMDAYLAGQTPEDIVQSFDVLRLDDVYATITYYLRHREQLDAYLEEGKAIEAEGRREFERRHPPGSIRKRLLERLGRAEA